MIGNTLPIVLLLVLAGGGRASAEIIKDPSLCSRTRCIVRPEQKFKYAEGVLYRYYHSVDVSTNLGGVRRDATGGEPRAKGHGEPDESTLFIDSTVTIHFASPCEGYMKITNSSIRHDRSNYNREFPDRADAEFRAHLERHTLRFAFDDGHVREVCPEAGEVVWALNIKRGILSMLQNTMKRFDVDRRVNELDVSGICETRYRLHEAKRTSLIIKKTKDLASCSHAGKHLSVVQSTFYRSPLSNSRRFSQPLLRSYSDCDITIDHNVYEKVECRESHHLVPFSNGASAGARTNSVAVLTLIEESKDADEEPTTDDYDDGSEEQERRTEDETRASIGKNIISAKRTSLLYDHAASPRAVHGELRTCRDLLKSMCLFGTSDELDQRFSEMYTKFIHSARLLDYPSMSQLLARSNSICKGGRKHIIDALPFIGSNSAVKVMRDLIRKKAVDRDTTVEWVTAFALIPRPDAATLLALMPLLDFEREIPEAQFILSYSAVVHAYCASQEPGHCAGLGFEPIDNFIRAMEEKIEKGCSPRAHDLTEIMQTLEALKAVGNMGLDTATLSKRLKTCIDNSGAFLPMEVRISAIEAYRRLPSCPETRDSIFLNYYRNSTLDSEIRIASYLQVMRCPDYNVIKMIKHTLKHEQVNQVGSFVWSHLTNLLASSSPTRVEIQSLLTDRDLGNKFNSDLRKYSRNYEKSVYSEEWNFGANYQSNLIFSSKSYVPRSASFNVTIDLFGESVNAFEVSMRMEGMEYYVEKIFGPEGPLSGEKLGNHFSQFLRAFRSARNTDENHWDKVRRLPNVIDNNFDDPRISVSYKIFGNELRFKMLNGDGEIRASLASLNPWTKVKQILSGREIHYENTVMFLDSSYVVPTSSGLPVRLELMGSAAYNYKFSGLLESERLASNTEIEVVGNVTPSFSVDVTGRMIVDAFYKSAGLKLRSSVYSFGAVQLHLKIKGARLVRLGLDLPNRSMEVISVRTDVLLVSTNGAETKERPVGKLLTGKSKNKLAPVPETIVSNTTCSWPSLERLIGLKLCADYQFPNVTKISNASYFILNGPTLFRVSVIKADPTAKSYLLEYKWTVTPEESVVRLAFDTPGSRMNRELSATVSFDKMDHNMTVLLRSAGNSLVAKGTYKRTDDEAMIDVGLDINGTKHLDASIGYTRKRGNYGFTYNPKVYLAINSERIAELSGTIRNAQKLNISQCDIDLSFETKKVKSRVHGYIMRREMSLKGNVKLDYQLNKSPKKETLQVEISLVNRSSKTLTHKEANLKLHSTAYPQLNVEIATWYQQALGHIELHAEINTKPHLEDIRHKLTAQLVLTHSRAYFQSQEAKINAFIAITKPIQNLDIKVGVQHFAVGASSKTNFLIRYAPGKEISLAVNMVTPRGNMFAIEGHANLTIPNFNSMLIDASISERSRREYDLDFSGTWFSGHNITIRGIYADRSTTVIVSHSLKVTLTSPSFQRDILLNCKLYQDATDLKINLHLEHLDLEKYALIVDHSTISPTRLTTYAEGRYRNSIYTMTTNVDTEREVRVELHLDRWRDVHVTATSINEPETKEFGIQIKWDANRDPDLKFATVVQLNKFVDEATFSQNISGTVIITYPNRLVTGSCLFARQARTNYLMDTRLDWGPDKTIRLTIDTDYGMTSWPNSLKFESQLLTPFDNWRKTSLNARYRQSNTQIGASCSAYWQDDQRILLEFQGNTDSSPDLLECNGLFSLTSTVHSIAWLTANFTHVQVPQKSINSSLVINYDPDRVIDLKSFWTIDRDEENESMNVTGHLKLTSPVANYRKGEMKCELRLLPNWRFYGASNVDLDRKKYTAVLVGDLARLKESLVEINVTTPHERYAFLRGRFGLSERDRHVVAEVLSPSGSLGFEALCQLFTGASYDFNVKLQLATPIDLLQKSLFVAKLNRREADFRVAYNNITAGFQGVWHYNNLTDFHYSYVLLTPIHGLHESGIVAKLVAVRTEPCGQLDLDTEFSLRIVETKVGIQAHGGPKPPPPALLIASSANTRVEQPRKKSDEDDEEADDDEEEDEIETFYWKGDVEINAAIIAPIVGTADIDVEGPIYKFLGYLKLPQGRIVVDDRFTMEDFFNMRNELSIDTPFASASEITSHYVFNIDSENSVYLMESDLNILTANRTYWAETGISANYSYAELVEDTQTHNLELRVKTPLRSFKYVNTSIVYEVDENLYKARTTIATEASRTELAGSLELEDGFLDAAISAQVDSPALYIPRTKIVVKKDFTDKEKRVELAFHLAEPEDRSAEFQAAWLVQGDDYVKASFALETWIASLRNVEAQVLYANSIAANNSAELRLNLRHSPEQEYRLTGDLKNGTIDLGIQSPLPAYERLHFRGDLERPQADGPYVINGDLKNLKTSEIYEVITSVVVGEGNVISQIDVRVTPRNGGYGAGRVDLKLRRDGDVLAMSAHNDHVRGTLDLTYANALNWDVDFKAARLRSQVNEGDKPDYDIYELKTNMDVQTNGNTSVTVRARTPWRDIEIFSLDGNLLLEAVSGQVTLRHRLNENTSHGLLAWRLAYMIDMFGRIVAGVNDRSVDARLFLKNPKKAFKNVEVGFDVDVDRERWRLGANTTVGYKDSENVDVVVSVRLPPPDNDDHRLLLSYHGNHGIQDARFVVGYNALRANKNYASDGSIRMAAQNLDSHLRVTWGNLPSQTLNNILNVTFDQKSVDIKYSLYTPKHQTEETAIFLLSYDATPEVYSLLNADLYYPAATNVATARISYTSLSNVNGTVNATTPIPQFSYAGCNFIVHTSLKQNRKFAEVFWPNKTALFNSDYNYHSERLDSTLEGVLQLEIPLSTRHAGRMTYGYKKRPLMTNGYAQMTYNTDEILNATYNSKGESRAGFEKDRTHIIVQNVYMPIGVTYVNQYEYSAGNGGTNYPTVELKKVNVYGLESNTTLKVAGESRVKTTHDGQEIYLKGVHYNRTIQLKTDYQVLPGEFDQNTWLSLADDAWASYHINILNKTTQDVDNQFLILNLAYPRRNFTFGGSYKLTTHDFDSEAKLTWDEDKDQPRMIGTSLRWRNSTDESAFDRQVAVLSFRHPSFAKDVTFTGKLMEKDPRELFNSLLVVDYSTNPDKLLVLSAILRDESETPGDIRYSYSITGNHPRTQLDLRVNGNVRKHGVVLLETDHRGLYKRSYLPQESGQLHGRVDANDYEIQFHRESNELVKHLNVRYYPADPDYVLNGTFINTPIELNATGAFYINVPKKLTWMMLNYTPDAVESLRMYGYIPDVRNAIFDIWRTYDQDLVVNDVSFYIKLNHSRLVTSKLKWRPELRDDIINLVKTSLTNVYDEMGKDIDYWKQYIKSETVDAVNDVWEDAREDIQQFLDDWDDLKSLEQDFDDLKIYLNGSYYANDFYIRDIVAIGTYFIDELSLRSHIESLPNIINEIWEIMGESGEALRNSLVWIIETIKTAYKKFTEIVSAVLRGESVTQIANIVEKIIEKYDMFVKDLHVSFIKYIQNLWNKFSEALSRQWNEMLRMVEPIFIRVIHYIEAVLWKVSKEVVDFLYDRRNEIIGSPYFDRFTNLTHDVDRIYRDIKANDIVTNVQKYSAIVIQFIRERYFNFVPFGKELRDLVDEIVSGLKELTKLPTVNFALEKVNQVYEKAKYLYEYFGVRAKIESVVRMAHSRLVEISQTALQAESRYREAKTKFIFDPDEGLLCLEQKLPMSWHAFNQTPEFQEIPEYRAIVDMKSYFTTSNTTFWTLYYQYKPYTEPSNWLPPFRAQAMIVGSQHFITFDDHHLDFAGSCTYLLARDFIRDHFAVLIEYDRDPLTNKITHRIIVLIGRKAIELDVFKDTVKLVDTGAILQLPVEFENGQAFVYQEESIVTVETKHEQFKLRCNLKYDLCILELSGFYFGKTAGLLGTMNNEPMDDALSSNGRVLQDIGEFAQSWSLERPKCVSQENFAVTEKRGPLEFCDWLFVNKSSEFSGCFNVVNPDRYADTCATSKDEAEVCTLAMSYMQMCSFYDTYLRIPDKCTTCPMHDGSIVPEGEFRKLDGDKVPRTTDVVFIVEAKHCNEDIRQNRSVDQLITQLSKELEAQGLTDNRWSLVTFGGDGVYDRPRNLILENRIFTEDPLRFADYFSNIPTGTGNQDIFAAIGFASQLVFRAGVSKTFVLMPCSHCEPQNQTLDYSVLHQVLLEHDITLHILMDDDFHFKKQRVNKVFYGLDARKSYTRKDVKALVGDVDLRRQVKLSKNALGYCAPLSLETNGTIFSGNKLRFEKATSIKKFASVFAKRVAVGAQPSSCQHCECTADNDGITHMECMPCVYPMPVAVDYVSETFNEDDALSMLQPLDFDYGQPDAEDE